MSPKQLTKIVRRRPDANHDKLLDLEAKYCSWGDTVHYAEKLNIFKSSEGCYLYDH